jgi:hypothetical protein
VAFTGMMVDFARIQMVYEEVSSAADLSASSAAAYYDSLLKDVYGLFAVSQDKKAEQFAVDYAMSALGLDKAGNKEELSFNLIATGKSKVDVNVKSPMAKTGDPTYSLRNTAYFTQQVGQYMEYRVIVSLMELAGIFSNDKLGSAFADGGEKAENAQVCINRYNDEILKLYGLIFEDYRNIYARIQDVMEYETGQKPVYLHRYDVAGQIGAISNSGIIDLRFDFRDASPKNHPIYYDFYGHPIGYDFGEFYRSPIYRDLDADAALVLRLEMGDFRFADGWRQEGWMREFIQITGYEASGYRHLEKTETGITALFEFINGNEDKAGVIGCAKAAIKERGAAKWKVFTYETALQYIKFLSPRTEAKIIELKKRIADMLNDMQSMKLEDDFRDTMEKELRDRDKELILGIAAAGGDFYDANMPEFQTVSASVDAIAYGQYELEGLLEKAEKHNPPFNNELPLDEEWEVDIYEFGLTPYNEHIYAMFEKMSQEVSDKDPDKENEENEKRENDAKSAKEELERDNSKDVPANFYNAWHNEYKNTGTADNGGDDNMIKKLLLIEYGMQNLTNAVTNKKVIDNSGTVRRDEKTLSGVPKGTAVNHLYQREMEYVCYGGRTGNYTRFVVTLGAIFFVANWLYTWVAPSSIPTIQPVINALRCIPFVGFAIGEVYRVGISLAESVHDMSLLLGGKKAAIIKGGDTWWFGNLSYNGQGLLDSGALYYDQYLRVFLLFNSGEELAARMTDMIELNMNHYKGGENGIANRDRFLAAKAFVIYDVSIDIKMPYFFMSMPFIADQARAGFNTKTCEISVTKTRGY